MGMQADVKLDGVTLVPEGNDVRCVAPDIKLDCPDRRSSPDGPRRALVHDSETWPNTGDQLVLNYDGDYPGGVLVVGGLRIRPKPGKTITYTSLALTKDGGKQQWQVDEVGLLEELEHLRWSVANLSQLYWDLTTKLNNQGIKV